MFSLRKPTTKRIDRLLSSQAELAYSYEAVGATSGEAPAGYDQDCLRVCLGRGRADFEVACRAVRHWRMFPDGWTSIHPRQPTITEGTTVAVLARCFRVWWLNPCRIVYTIDERNAAGQSESTGSEIVGRFGFAYGTLPEHAERGEERFVVEIDADERVWYELSSFSQPRYWLARLFYPLARRLQHQFAHESTVQMQRAVAGASLSDSSLPTSDSPGRGDFVVSR